MLVTSILLSFHHVLKSLVSLAVYSLGVIVIEVMQKQLIIGTHMWSSCLNFGLHGLKFNKVCSKLIFFSRTIGHYTRVC